MFFPYYHNISIEDLYCIFNGYECSEDKDARSHFYNLQRFSWRVIPLSHLIFGKLTFVNFSDLYSFVKFAYIVYPYLCVTLLYQSNEKDSKLSFRPLEGH